MLRMSFDRDIFYLRFKDLIEVVRAVCMGGNLDTCLNIVLGRILSLRRNRFLAAISHFLEALLNPVVGW